jgi:Tfp pilus assembly protein PilO
VTKQLHELHYHEQQDTIKTLRAEVDALKQENQRQRETIATLHALKKDLQDAHNQAEVAKHLHEEHQLRQTIAGLRADLDKREHDKEKQREMIMDMQAQAFAAYNKTEEHRKKFEKAQAEVEKLRAQLAESQK